VASRLVPPDADRFARGFLDTLREGRNDAAVRLLAPQLAAIPTVAESLEVVRNLMPPGTFQSVEIVGVYFVPRGASSLTQIRYQMEAGGKWAVVQVLLEGSSSDRRVAGVRVWPLRQSLQAHEPLSLRGASAGALLLSVIGFGLLAFSLYAAALMVKSPTRYRWLWAAVAIVGFGRIAVEWRTGAVRTQWLVVGLVTGLGRDAGYGPWWVFVSLPGGAILALERRRRALAAHRAAAVGAAADMRDPSGA